MDGFPSGYRCSGGDRRVEIVSGKSFGANQKIYASCPRSPDRASNPPRATRAGQSSATVAKPWSFNDPEVKRRKRIAKYKVYSVEGKVKASLGQGFRWIKNKCSEIVHGF